MKPIPGSVALLLAGMMLSSCGGLNRGGEPAADRPQLAASPTAAPLPELSCEEGEAETGVLSRYALDSSGPDTPAEALRTYFTANKLDLEPRDYTSAFQQEERSVHIHEVNGRVVSIAVVDLLQNDKWYVTEFQACRTFEESHTLE